MDYFIFIPTELSSVISEYLSIDDFYKFVSTLDIPIRKILSQERKLFYMNVFKDEFPGLYELFKTAAIDIIFNWENAYGDLVKVVPYEIRKELNMTSETHYQRCGEDCPNLLYRVLFYNEFEYTYNKLKEYINDDFSWYHIYALFRVAKNSQYNNILTLDFYDMIYVFSLTKNIDKIFNVLLGDEDVNKLFSERFSDYNFNELIVNENEPSYTGATKLFKKIISLYTAEQELNFPGYLSLYFHKDNVTMAIWLLNKFSYLGNSGATLTQLGEITRYMLIENIKIIREYFDV